MCLCCTGLEPQPHRENSELVNGAGMNLWVLHKRPTGMVEPYELTRLREEARALAIRFEAVAPEEIDLIVSRGGRRSIRRCGAEVQLPDGVAVVNPSSAIEAVKDKLYAHQILAQSNLPIPRTMLVRFPVDPHLVAQQIGFPCVIKLLVGSYGDGVVLSRDPASFRDLMELVSGLDRSQSLILQQYIGTRPGKDLRVWVIGGQVIGAMLRSSTDGSFKANISRGGDGQAFPLNPELERLARDSAAALNLDIAGVDLLFDGDGYSICEVNSAPGFQGFETATGLNLARLVLEHCRSTVQFLPPVQQRERTIPPDFACVA